MADFFARFVQIAVESAVNHTAWWTLVAGLLVGSMLERWYLSGRIVKNDEPRLFRGEIAPPIDVDNDSWVAMRIVDLRSQGIDANPLIVSYKRDGKTFYMYKVLLPDGKVE